MNDWMIELLPFPLTLLNCACYEACGKPIILTNGAKVYPKGYLRFLKMTSEEVLGD